MTPSTPTDAVSVSPSSDDSCHGRTAQFLNHTGVRKFCTVDRRHAAGQLWLYDCLEPGVDGRYVVSQMLQLLHGMWCAIKAGPVLVIRDFSLLCHTL